jgi:hypothetical protein
MTRDKQLALARKSNQIATQAKNAALAALMATIVATSAQ